MSQLLRAIRNLGSLGAKLSKHAPGLLTALGICGYGYSVYTATKVPEKTKAVQEEYKKTGDKKRFIRGYAKAVAPTVTSFGLSTLSVLTGHNLLRGRCLKLSAAFTLQKKAFDAYRKRVKAKEGEEADMCYSLGIKETADIVPGENGEMEVVHQQELTGDPASLYTMVFDERNPEWEKDPAHNIAFLRRRLESLNDRLKLSGTDFVKGHLSVMDVWVDTRFDRLLTKEQANAALCVGWTEDTMISFGKQLDDLIRDPRPYLQGKIPYIIIELNPEGVLLDRI